ncbi:MAG: leucyl aminopeptidase [Gemmatimonadaceae bacterium]|nr:leucyl aminopeptidase [Gemmatimonadaceae bacterium]MCW5825208.1 leucyl aminopeptidase [Gemmatimonadaceae bacterium]
MSLQFTATTSDPARAAVPLLAVVLPSDAKLPKRLTALDRATKGALSLALKRGDFSGAKDEALLVVNPGPGPQRVLLVGSGAGDTKGVTRAATLAGRKANALNVGTMGLWAEDLQGERVEAVVVGLSLGSWEFRELMAPPAGKPRKPLTAARVFVENAEATKAPFAAGVAVAEGQRLARRLAMLPGNICTPSYLADTARDIAKRLGLKASVLGRKEMTKLGMGSFLAVAQGTTQDPKLIVLEYSGGRRGEAPVVLVGKGLCFDTGGVSIKPAPGMELMKFDMSGAAGVLGAMEAIGRLKPKVNVVALVGSTTNVVDGDAIRPGDVVRAGDGTTIEIQNTDAEGRLVLADVLHYAKRYKPQAVVDAATLTGAVVIALGNVTFGVMGNDQATIDEVLAASRRGGELAWQLPLFEEYKEQLKSDVADLRNIGGRGAGTITAGLFLQHFAGEMKWVHLDVAGTAYSETDLVVLPKGPTGVPVRTFVEFVRGRAR